jgi:hypothetical protein
MMDGEQFKINQGNFGNLPELHVYGIVVDKTAVKEYLPYSNQQSNYLPTGMQGPMVKLLGSIDDLTPWLELYSNDYLKVVSFTPTNPFQTTLYVDSQWWVDTISDDTKPGFRRGSKMRYELSLDIYLKTDV